MAALQSLTPDGPDPLSVQLATHGALEARGGATSGGSRRGARHQQLGRDSRRSQVCGLKATHQCDRIAAQCMQGTLGCPDGVVCVCAGELQGQVAAGRRAHPISLTRPPREMASDGCAVIAWCADASEVTTER